MGIFGMSGVLGVIMPVSDKLDENEFFPSILGGLSEAAHAANYSLHLITGSSEEEQLYHIYDLIKKGQVHGFILLNSYLQDKVMDYLLEMDVPFVVVGRPIKNSDLITYVDNNNVVAARDATTLLLELNHKRIGFIGGNSNLVVTRDRLLGFQWALKEAGYECQSEDIIYYNAVEGNKMIKSLLSQSNPPSAFVIVDDVMALEIINTLGELNISVPNDISIVSFNNSFIGKVSTPSLTSVDIDVYKLGYEATKQIINIISHHKKSKSTIVQHHLIMRSSCRRMETSVL